MREPFGKGIYRVFQQAVNERQRDVLKGTVRLLKEADRVNAPLHDIQPEKTLTGMISAAVIHP